VFEQTKLTWTQGNNWTIGLVDVKDKILKFKGNVSNDCSTIKAKLVPAGRVKQIQYIPWVNANNVETQELYQGEQTRKVYTNFKGKQLGQNYLLHDY
jgi:hypothetical protein